MSTDPKSAPTIQAYLLTARAPIRQAIQVIQDAITLASDELAAAVRADDFGTATRNLGALYAMLVALQRIEEQLPEPPAAG